MLSRTAGTLFTTPSCKTLACQNLITRQKPGWQKGQNARPPQNLGVSEPYHPPKSGWQKGQNARPSRVKARERTYVRDRA